MKYRKGFVSNSSSSSFVCDVCGYETSGWDLCLSEAEMNECECGHVFCDEHIIYPETQEELRKIWDKVYNWVYTRSWYTDEDREEIKNYISENINLDNIKMSDIENFADDWLDGFRYSLPEEMCPLCNFEELSMSGARRYLVKTTQYTENEVFEYVKSINKRRKKLRDNEYVEYVCEKLGTNTTLLLKELDEKFEHSYRKFLDFLSER